MPEYLQALILISSGVGLCLICVITGAWIMFRGKVTPGIGEGFLKNAKGEVFNVPEDRMVDEPPGLGEPSADEKRAMEKAKGFLKVLGGGE